MSVSSRDIAIAEGNRLFEMGYRQVSRKYRLVSRVNLTDFQFKLFMMNQHPYCAEHMWDPTNEGTRDYYRRCHAKHKTVSEEIMQQIRKRS